ncbi:GNAT family N-acetyltransferase [Psychroserpens algicola]|uniref:GNAT family N-acetyltransferase n=1 Tax=Psychroserpens algicola TaxID=1719034 RepID=UPI001952FC1F|nr:GNAT family N-acetyltransferase [Psychroserpens algicola]
MNIKVKKVNSELIIKLKKWYQQFTNEDNNNLRFRFEEDTFYVAKIDDEIVGILGYEDHNSFCCDFKRFVVREYRNKNIAELLLDFLIVDARINNKRAIDCTLNSHNEKGINFLTKKGFDISKGELKCYAKLNL